MAQVLITETYLDDIADAIRFKNGSETTYTPSQMAPAIRALSNVPEGYLLPEGTLEITANGEYDIEQYAKVNVNFQAIAAEEGHVVEDANGMVIFSAESGLSFQNKTVTPSDSQQVIQPDSEYDGLLTVTVNAVPASTYVPRSEVITYHVDTADPTSEDGNEGDIWLVMGA